MKIRLAQFEMDDGAAEFFEFLGTSENGQGAFAGQLRNARCNPSHDGILNRITCEVLCSSLLLSTRGRLGIDIAWKKPQALRKRAFTGQCAGLPRLRVPRQHPL